MRMKAAVCREFGKPLIIEDEGSTFRRSRSISPTLDRGQISRSKSGAQTGIERQDTPLQNEQGIDFDLGDRRLRSGELGQRAQRVSGRLDIETGTATMAQQQLCAA